MPPKTTTPKVFISYAWKNQIIAKQMERDLMRDGIAVFIDFEKISGGDSLPSRINAALDWCDTLVLLWSTDAAQSRYVAEEWESAFHLEKRIIPCILDSTTLPALLRKRLYLNFSPYETGYEQLCHSLGVDPKTGTITNMPTMADQSIPASSLYAKALDFLFRKFKGKRERIVLNPSIIIELDERKLVVKKDKWILERYIVLKARTNVDKYLFRIDWTGSSDDIEIVCRNNDGVLEQKELVTSKTMRSHLWELRFKRPLLRGETKLIFLKFAFPDSEHKAAPYHYISYSNVWACKELECRLLLTQYADPRTVYFIQGDTGNIPIRKIPISAEEETFNEYVVHVRPNPGAKYYIEWESKTNKLS